MSGELRALGLAHGLILGLLLACPLFAPGLLPWGIDALLLVGGFQLRLADRRFALRPGAKNWISHILMAPRRLIRWGAAAVVALIAGDAGQAQAVIVAALLCEVLAYPLSTLTLGRRPLPWVAGALTLLLVIDGISAAGALHHMLVFTSGVIACLVWLRGPDGEPRALALAMGSGLAAAVTPIFLPGTLPFAVPLLVVCTAWSLAHLSMLRRRPMPWGLAGRFA